MTNIAMPLIGLSSTLYSEVDTNKKKDLLTRDKTKINARVIQ